MVPVRARAGWSRHNCRQIPISGRLDVGIANAGDQIQRGGGILHHVELLANVNTVASSADWVPEFSCDVVKFTGPDPGLKSTPRISLSCFPKST